MKLKFCIILFFALLTTKSFAQESFEVLLLKDTKENIKKVENKFKKSKILYNDNKYLVTSTCSGEFGGTIIFKEKSTKKTYSAHSTCPISVDKLDNDFYITNSLAHRIGSTEILRIEKPNEMEVYPPLEQKIKKKRGVKPTGHYESKSKKGTEQILDSIGAFTLATFEFRNRFYYIVTNFEKTYLAKIENKKFATILELPVNNVWGYDPRIIKKSNNHIILLFNDEQIKGYLEVENNKLKIVRE